jgi:hypothetical protein
VPSFDAGEAPRRSTSSLAAMSALRKYFLFLAAFAVAAVVVHAASRWDLGLVALALFVGWPLAGTLITIDDDFPDGWSNPDGKTTPEWKTLAWWANIILCRGAIALMGFAYDARVDKRWSIQLLAAALVMSATGFPIVIRALRSNYAVNS